MVAIAARPVLYVAHPLRPTDEEVRHTLSFLCEEKTDAAVRELRDRLGVNRAMRIAASANLHRALAWRNWLRSTFDGVTFVAPWIGDVLAGDDDNDPAQRARGLRDNCALIIRLDGIVMCGPRISEGMKAEVQAFMTIQRPEVTGLLHERQVARRKCIYDLTSLGATPPTAYVFEHESFDSWVSNVLEGRL